MQYLLLVLLILIAPGLAQAFEDPLTAVAASQYRQLIQDTHPRQASDRETRLALQRAERYSRQKLWDEAIAEYQTAIAGGLDKTSVWIGLSRVWQSKKKQQDQDRQRALQAAYNAYRAARTADEKARALFLLGDLYDRQERPKEAIAAFKEGLGIEDNPRIAERYRKLVEAHAFQVKGVDVEADSAVPKICLRFSEPLKRDRRIHYQDYLMIEPVIKAVVDAQDRRLCIKGVSHGQSYKITLRPGVPSAFAEKTRTSETFTATVGDREPNLGFRGTTYILPKRGAQDLPLTSVNVEAARLKLLRINDRNLTEQINNRQITMTLGGHDIKTLVERSGELIWEGKLIVEGKPNQETTTAIPVGEILNNTEPGIYVITAEPADQEIPQYKERATQWLVVSDLGLFTLKGQDGLHVFVRSLDSAHPLAGVELRLYARNNSELGQGLTDANGYAAFAPGLLRGEGGREPAALMAYGKNGDFNFLDLTRPAFDLSDRGVTGREAPGPVDVFLYTERGVYRPGEAVELMALARNERGYAVKNLPLILKIIRPDQVEVDRLSLQDADLGGYHATIALAGNARTGTWTVRAYTDPEAKPVGEQTFQVEDFVPQRLKLELKPEAEVLSAGETMEVAVTGRFLYGAPAAHLKAQAELVLRQDADPYPAYPGYQFGLVQESWNAKRYPLDLAGTDDQGKARLDVRLNEIPDSTLPLKAVLRVSLFEPGGRPVNRSLGLPYRIRPFAIGIRPQFEDNVRRGQEAVFNVIAVNANDRLQAVDGLHYALYREEYEYYWYYRNNRWDYKLIIRDSDSVAEGDLRLFAEQPAVIARKGLDWGNYRLEIDDPETGAASSVRFQVGWFVNPSAGDTPDQLKVTLDKPRYRVGEAAQVFIKAPFAGEVLLTVVGNRLWTTRHLALPAAGVSVELPVVKAWEPGVYITATAFRPAQNPSQRGPGRAIGVAWLGLDAQPRTLNLVMETPKEVRPRQVYELPVKVEGIQPNETAYLTVAAVDEGILQLTDFKTPAPLDYFLGKRRLGMDILDLYGQLIETGGRLGELRSGGDGQGRQLEGSGVRTVKTVALFSGPIALDDQGQARIPLALPDFNGELRLMAIAWDESRLGEAEASLLVRDPLVAQVYLPRFLAPGDSGQLTLTLQNLSAPAGDYRIRLATDGAVAFGEGEKRDSIDAIIPLPDLQDQALERRAYPLRGLEPGSGRIYLHVQGPAGFNLARSWEIGIRPAQAIVSERHALRLAPDDGFQVTTELVKDYVPGTGQVNIGFSTRPNLNVAGLLAQLDRYPYGCLEQTTSRALPLLYFNEVAAVWLGEKKTDMGVRNRVQEAIQRILALQRYDGGFGLWNPDSPAERWLSAYALEFLTRAREQGYLVPESAYQRGLDWLKESLNETQFDAYRLAARAYALYVLARAEQAPLGELRYLHDNDLHKLPTRLAQAQLGAALARYGERNRAREAFEAALDPTFERDELRDYGTPLRDRAALVALLAEVHMMERRLPQLAEELAADANSRHYTSTQEQAWLLLAADALLQQPGELRLKVGGRTIAPEEDAFYLRPTPLELKQGITVINQGSEPLWYVVNLSGVPAQEQPPVKQGFSIVRRFYTRAGEEVDLTRIQQNDLLVAVISGEVLTQEPHQALIVDLLPGGLEIENSRLAHHQSTAEFGWLPELSETLNSEFRDDRFVAAIDLDRGQRKFAAAYLVRAVTPGEYRLPAVFVEDMYKPWYFARAAMGKIRIK